MYDHVNNMIADVVGDVALVLALASLFGAIARRLGQPRVVGQMVAGIVLGPSVLGRLPGHLTTHLFPKVVIPVLNDFSQIAIVIFIFGVGYELTWGSLGGKRRALMIIPVAALLVPMLMGSGSVLLLRSLYREVGQPHATAAFVLFIGVALSITAFPVLASIVRERGLSRTIPGATATSSAGLMDVAAWLVLAWALLGTKQHSSVRWPWPLVLIVCFAAVLLGVVRPALRWWIRRPGSLMSNQLPVAIVLALGCAWITSVLGLHPFFGGFLAGIAMPSRDGKPDPAVLRAMDEVGSLLLPVFFAVTGLTLDIGTLNGAAWIMLALVCGIASTGKLGPGYVSSRLGGLTRQDSATVAVLLNTRGLTELIALNVGLTAGLIDERLYTVLVLMALIMTMSTVPLLTLIRSPVHPQPAGDPGSGDLDSVPSAAAEP
jgi:Kef-type K+ transport system membrane component KefB